MRDKIKRNASTLELNAIPVNETMKEPPNGKKYYRQSFLPNLG